MRIALLSVTLGLLLWGWFALTLSPVERYYFPAYVGSSLHMRTATSRTSVAWLVKTRPKNKIDFAEPEDLVPTTQGTAPFALSADAVEQGWTRGAIAEADELPGRVAGGHPSGQFLRRAESRPAVLAADGDARSAVRSLGRLRALAVQARSGAAAIVGMGLQADELGRRT